MILVDPRKGSGELLPLIRKLGVQAQHQELPFGDFCFEGNGKKGRVMVGVERKALHDMLQCIDDARYAAYQRPGMAEMYDVCILLVEGSWRPKEDGILMELFRGVSWGECRYRSSRVMYSKLYRYLLSIGLSGVIITYSRDVEHTAFNVVECFHYFQKKWSDHTSLLEVQKFAIPDMSGKPSLALKWATQLDGIGVKFGHEAARMFKTGFNLASSDEMDWIKIPGVGVKTAQKVIKEIRGWL